MKMVYSSLVIEIIEKLGESKARVGLGLTAYYITYAISQMSLAPFVKKINLGKLMLYTVAASAILYGLIPFTTQLYQLWIIMALNGVMHASVWGGCMYYFGKYLPAEMNEIACSIMSMGFVGGTVVSFVIAPFFIMQNIWQYTFLLFAAIQFVSVVAFMITERRVERYFAQNGSAKTPTLETVSQAETNPSQKSTSKSVLGILVICAAACFFINFPYYGLTNWFSSYLNNVFGLKSTYSVWLTIILHLLSFIGTNFCLALCRQNRKRFPGMLVISGYVVFVLTAAHIFSYNVALVLGIAFPALFTATNRVAGTLLASYLPLQIKAHINAATTAMVLNAMASLGAAFAPTFFGAVIDGGGWQTFFISVAVIGVTVLISLILSARAIKKLNA